MIARPRRHQTGLAVSLPTLRRVWAAVTRDPRARLRQLATETDLAYTTVRCALIALAGAGYIETGGYGKTAARRIVVPFR